MNDTYSGRNVVITGGSSGIGLATAKLLVDGGARVLITGRSRSALDTAVARLGENALAFRGDVASLADLDALASHARDHLGTVEALFVNAGVTSPMPFESTTEEMFDQSFAVNVKGAFFTVQKIAPLLSTGAGVVLTTSAANVMGMLEASVYAAGKAALRSMVRSLSRELLPRGIRVNAVSPGPVDTGILESTMTREAGEQFKAERVAENPMRRFGTPEEVARTVAFLAFDATYTAGAEFVVDGGITQL
ncbi:SDR family oxidoreductase [Saccharopolyspora sp. CA-218241]|uniref:SDR family oxidoreductase n=1 Tax=Saccharopolyspora sp. CA-218241 TaxID=3240027 RepID=UPI003D9833D8